MRSAAPILALLFGAACVSQIREPVPAYERKQWRHWIDSDRDCLDTRAEILKERSKIPVTMNKKGCAVMSGVWDDYYFPAAITRAALADIDHIIPLKHAHDHGGAAWSPEQKQAFANDPENLVVTDRKYNRSKGAKTPLEWLPSKKDYACRYLSDWIRLKTKYELRIEANERSAVEGCNPEE
jgi:hypothetical protein